MNEKPILFSAPMVRALLKGSKTQTRRIVKPQPTLIQQVWYWFLRKESVGFKNIDSLVELMLPHCPYGKVGDQLWVRETFTGDKNNFGYRADAVCGGMGYDGDGQKIFMKHGYILDETCKQTYIDSFKEGFNTYGLGHFSGKWKPSIHMLRWASRIQLEIIEIGIERLQNISAEDAIAEGISECGHLFGDHAGLYSPDEIYSALWESINGAGSWNANPWVWVVEFKVVKP